MENPTRGERNNNPGNLMYVSSIPYIGELGIEISSNLYSQRFARFDIPENGIRALCVCLLAYYKHHGCDTVTKVINRWAPGFENNTAAYIAAVCNDMNVGPNNVILLSDKHVLANLAKAIIHHENGRVSYDDITIALCADKALQTTTSPTPPRLLPAAPPPAAPETDSHIAQETRNSFVSWAMSLFKRN